MAQPPPDIKGNDCTGVIHIIVSESDTEADNYACMHTCNYYNPYSPKISLACNYKALTGFFHI